MDFTCNICGALNSGVEEFDREVRNCAGCASSVRIRSLIYALSNELFGVALLLPDFPVLKGLRGAGMTDTLCYAQVLAEKFDYKNTYYDREPKLDITNIDGQELGALDFLISSEVFEHVTPPLEASLENSFRLLEPRGVLLLSMPWGLDHGPPSMEHFPELSDYGMAPLQSGPVLVNRTAQGELQVFDNLIFHEDSGPVLEMRRLTVAELRRSFSAAGFTEIRFYTEDYPAFGIRHTLPWAMPIAAHKQPLMFDHSVRAEVMAQFGEMRAQLRRAGEVPGLLRDLEQQVSRLEAELTERTQWALGLDQELETCKLWGASLEKEVESRTAWAKSLEGQFQDRTKWAVELDSRAQLLENELGALRSTLWNRLGRLLRAVR